MTDEEMLNRFVAENERLHEHRRKINNEFTRRCEKARVTALVVMLVGLATLPGVVFLDWHWLVAALPIWMPWPAMLTVDYIRGAMVREVFR